MPQEGGAATRLWRFEHAGVADEVRSGRVGHHFCGAGRMSRLVRMNALGDVRGVCERRYGRIQVMDASLAAAGGKPARWTYLPPLADITFNWPRVEAAGYRVAISCPGTTRAQADPVARPLSARADISAQTATSGGDHNGSRAPNFAVMHNSLRLVW